MSKTPELVIPDIYKMLESHEAPVSEELSESIIEQFGEDCKEALRGAIAPAQDRTGLRLSGIGRPARKLWQAYYGIRGEDLDGPTYIKFLYGHLTEALVLSLAKLAGHSVTEEQKEIKVEGVKGHQDCRLDGLLIDVKSASSFGFKKFKYNKLHLDDPFGYIPQLKCYAHADGDTRYGWLALEKQSGELALLVYDETDKGASYADAVDWDAAERVREVKMLMEGPLPSKCFEPVPDGKAGNLKLQSGCSYCEFREVCWPDARTFHYSTGPKYLTTVIKDPRVPEDTTAPEGF